MLEARFQLSYLLPLPDAVFFCLALRVLFCDGWQHKVRLSGRNANKFFLQCDLHHTATFQDEALFS